MDSASDGILTVADVAERLRVSREHLRCLLRDGVLVPTFTVGKARRFTWADVVRQVSPDAARGKPNAA